MQLYLFRNFLFLKNGRFQTTRGLCQKVFESPEFYKPSIDLNTKEDEPNTDLLLSARVRPQVLRFFKCYMVIDFDKL
jgi:hypothetical protein